MQRLIHAQGLSTLADKLGMVFGTSKLKNCRVRIFVLKKCICMGNYLLLSGHYIWWDFVYAKNGFTTRLTRKTHPCLFSWFCPVFTQDKFCPRRLWRFPVWDKICKVETNHPNLLSVGDERKFVLIKSFLLVQIGPKSPIVKKRSAVKGSVRDDMCTLCSHF